MNTRFSGLQQLGRAADAANCRTADRRVAAAAWQPDVLGWAAMAAAGDAIFSNLGLLFAVGVGVGLAHENHGAAGLAALVGFLVTTRAVESIMTVRQTCSSGSKVPPAIWRSRRFARANLRSSASRSDFSPESSPASPTTA